MNPLFQAALEIQTFAQERRWPLCFIGGLSVLRWGELRMTQDVDVCLWADWGDEEPRVRELLSRFSSRIAGAEAFALQNRILLLTASNGVAMDIALGGLPFEMDMIQRATLFEFDPGVGLLTCSAEDLVVMKAFAGRSKDWADIEGILIRQRNEFDMDYARRQLRPLMQIKESCGMMEKLESMAAGLPGEKKGEKIQGKRQKANDKKTKINPREEGIMD